MMKNRKNKHNMSGRLSLNENHNSGTFSPSSRNSVTSPGTPLGRFTFRENEDQRSGGQSPNNGKKIGYGAVENVSVDPLQRGDSSSSLGGSRPSLVNRQSSIDYLAHKKGGSETNNALKSKLIDQGISPVFDPSTDAPTSNRAAATATGRTFDPTMEETSPEVTAQDEAASGGTTTSAPRQRRQSCLRKGSSDELDVTAEDFLTRPLPFKAGIVQCSIRRCKDGLRGKVFPSYELSLEAGNQFLLSAKKRSYNKTSNYIMSSDRNNHDKDSEGYKGKVRSNFVGTEFIIYDAGKNPKAGDEDATRCELGLVQYESNILGNRGPRRMVVCLPETEIDGTVNSIQPKTADESMSAKVKKSPEALDDLVVLENKRPQWNEQVGAYVLNFEGRVTMASVKNFQLVQAEKEEEVLLQFGRVEKDMFSVDFSWPLSPLQAFGICLSSFDYKLACE